MSRYPVLVWLALLTGCGPRPCDEGQVRADGDCVPYSADDPAPRPGDLWQPSPGTSWQWQLTGDIDTSFDVDMYDIDLFDVPDETFATLKDDGRVVVCYFSAGSHEEWREDAGAFPEDAIGKPLEGWPGERWLDIAHPGLRPIMEARLDRAVARGCDAVEPDNVDGFQNKSGFPLNGTEQLAYNRFLADAAHERGLSIGLKNDLGQIGDLVDWFDWALNEECATYHECGRLEGFTDAGKAAFHVEYVGKWSKAADKADKVCGIGELDTLIKLWDLTPERLACE